MSLPKFTRFENFEESRFWKQLKSLEKKDKDKESQTRIRRLVSSVDEVAKQSEYILNQIVRYLPQYTLHDKRHILNVLSLMDWLTPAVVMDQLAPLECALCILAAYVHDLGMALSKEEYDKLNDPANPKGEHYRRFRDRYPEELRQIQRLMRTGNPADAERAKLIDGHIRAEYIRTTHADPLVNRVNDWLEKIKKETGDEKLFYCGNYPYQFVLALIGLSHNMPAGWLRERLAGTDSFDRFSHLVGSDRVNFAFPGLLLRLADIMDFDATRAPGILFRHAGIDDPVSLREWTKHMAITGWRFEEVPSGLGLVYESRVCPDPVTHKTILSFVSQIEKEVHAVNAELHLQQGLLHADGRRYQINLPREVRPLVTEAQDPQSGRKLYIYQDIHFRLDQDEIQKLLMGTTLYGDPGLCIRELLQNALDALELRGLRLETPKKDRHEPVDDLNGGELRVELTWGGNPEKGEFICVTDWGVGMTRRVIEEYFTKVGKSYYKSADYRQEQAALARAGLVTSPISLFGIGILSCFMIAERMLVRTCPGDHDDGERQPFDVTISGPGSLFWLKPGTLDHQGTEITLYLKRGFQLQHNAQTLLNRLRKHFGYPTQTDEDPKTSSEIEEETGSKDQSKTIPTRIDPAFLAAAHVVWPRYPVVVTAPGENEPVIRIDDQFHLNVLAPIDPAKVVAKAKDWDFPESCVGRPCWTWWEWRDEGHDQATGSRVRLWFPAPRKDADPSGQGQAKDPTQDFPVDSPDGRLCRYHDLAAFVETQLEDDLRARVLVQGMRVQESDLATRRLGIAPAVGTRLSVDLRGGAAPGLTTDRRRMLVPEIEESLVRGNWEDELRRLFQRCIQALTSKLASAGSSTWHNMAAGFRWTGGDLPGPPLPPSGQFSLVGVAKRSASSAGGVFDDLLQLHVMLLQDLARDRDRDREFDGDLARDRDLAFARALVLARDRDRDPHIALDLDLDRARALDCALDRVLAHLLALDLALALAREFDRNRDGALDSHLALGRALALGRENARARARARDRDLMGMTLGSISQEGFRPDHSRSWPPLGLQGLRGQIGDAALAAPARVIFACESDGRTVRDADRDGTRCRRLIELGYNLVFPMVAIPLGHLRQACPTWRADRRVQPLGVAPFLFPEFHDIWPMHVAILRSIFGIPKIYALCPRIELWDKPFDDWSDEDWKTCGRSVLWKVTTGHVLWADGTHPIEKMPEIGRPAAKYFKLGYRRNERGRRKTSRTLPG